jgi:sarcosine oxidase subunit alpha
VANATGREARAVRRNVGIVDVSTLGKIDVQGADAAEFLERIYVNRWHTLKPGRIRYGLMLREDGMVFDDGTCTRLVAGRFFMTTTTAHAAQVLMHLERYAQTVWPDLEVHLTSTTDHWAAMAVAGPNSRAVLAAAVAGLDLSDEAFPHLAFGTGRVGDAPVRLFRMSYSGELAYEVHTPADWGLHVWERVMQAGRTMDITPYGTEAMNVLRIEKGHIVIGAEIDGRTTPDDLGMGALVKREPWFVGQRLLQRAALQAPERKKLVGLKAVDGSSEIPAGAQLVAAPYRNPPVPMLGHVTSSTYSVEHERPIALGLLAGGLAAHKNDILFAASPLTGQTVGVRVTPPVFVDPDGERPRG